MQFIKVWLECYSLFHNEKYVLTLIVIYSDVTANLRNKKLSVSQVDNWIMSIPSYNIFPTIPLTFDEVYWEAYGPIGISLYQWGEKNQQTGERNRRE